MRTGDPNSPGCTTEQPERRSVLAEDVAGLLVAMLRAKIEEHRSPVWKASRRRELARIDYRTRVGRERLTRIAAPILREFGIAK